MICNASILRLDQVTSVSGAGEPVYTNGSAVAVRCLMTGSKPDKETPTPPAIVETKSAELIVLRRPWLGASLAAPTPGMRVTVTVDGESSQIWRIAEVNGTQARSLGNWRLTLESF